MSYVDSAIFSVTHKHIQNINKQSVFIYARHLDRVNGQFRAQRELSDRAILIEPRQRGEILGGDGRRVDHGHHRVRVGLQRQGERDEI